MTGQALWSPGKLRISEWPHASGPIEREGQVPVCRSQEGPTCSLLGSPSSTAVEPATYSEHKPLLGDLIPGVLDRGVCCRFWIQGRWMRQGTCHVSSSCIYESAQLGYCRGWNFCSYISYYQKSLMHFTKSWSTGARLTYVGGSHRGHSSGSRIPPPQSCGVDKRCPWETVMKQGGDSRSLSSWLWLLFT